MRRLLVIVGALATAGCSNFRDAFSAHADTAAEAGSMTLTPERLGEILAGPKKSQQDVFGVDGPGSRAGWLRSERKTGLVWPWG